MIYTPGYAPCRFVAAEQRTLWSEKHRGNIRIHDERPAKPKGVVEEIPDVWFVCAELTGSYPDGSGKAGDPCFDGRWEPASAFRADDGIREIFAECERIAAGFS